MIIEDDDCDECIHEKSFINNLEETKNEARMAGAYQRPIKCAFKNGEFSSDNWNCGTLNKLSVIGNTVFSDEEMTLAYIPVNVKLDMISEKDRELYT